MGLLDHLKSLGRVLTGAGKSPAPRRPTLELRTCISPTDNNMRSLRYLMESIQAHGGPIARAARCVASVGSEEPPFDLAEKFPWVRQYNLDFHWVDPDEFEEWTYDATGFDRFWIESDADVVAMVDADLLVARDFDDIIIKAHERQKMLGLMAHVSPFGFKKYAQTPGHVWWKRYFDAADLEMPELTWQFSGWGMDWSEYKNRTVVSFDENHRYGPPYFNYGVVIGPRGYFETISETFVDELKAAITVVDNSYRSQVANCLAIVRHKIPCETMPIKYNFPLNLPGDAIRAVNPDPEGEDDFSQVRIFHYIGGGRQHFSSPETIQDLLAQADLPPEWRAFQKTLRIISERIDEAPTPVSDS